MARGAVFHPPSLMIRFRFSNQFIFRDRYLKEDESMIRWISLAFATMLGIGAFSTPAMAHPSDTKLIAAVRQATAKYLDVEKAKADGCRRMSNMVPNMGYHFLDAKIRGFALGKPNLLLYIKHNDGSFQLAGVEWGWPKGKQPENLPFKNIQWRDHGAACHYRGGSEVHDVASPKKCPKAHPKSGIPFAVWHPTLATVHVWAWYPNPAGVFKSHNTMLAPFNGN
jgi:hypothetical protein